MIIADTKELEKLLLKWIAADEELIGNQHNNEFKIAFSNQIVAYKNVLLRISPGYAEKWAEEERKERYATGSVKV